jgi:GTP pyrophosphokinase
MSTAATRPDRDFLDAVRAELFEDRVYALTPKARWSTCRRAPHPSTSRTTCTPTSAIAAGEPGQWPYCSAHPRLAIGEVVEILTHKFPQPSRDWLSETSGFLVSPRSRSKVRAWFRS